MSRMTQDATRWTAHEGLLDRRRKLVETIAAVGPAADLRRLLAEVDAALGRLDDDTYGRCAICREPFEEGELLENAMATWCRCELSPEQRNALEADHDLAWRIQAALLPRPDLEASGWEVHYRFLPAGIVSRDYCDVVTPHDLDGDVFFAVGDVSGEGVTAALLMSDLHASFRSHLRLGLPVGELVERASRVLFESTPASHYATLACGRLLPTGEVEVSNAGHGPSVRIGNGELSQVAPHGFPVGMFAHAPYPVETLTLAPGESLFFHTDGLTETRDERDREYGEERLREVLRDHARAEPRELADACLEDLQTFRGAAPTTDDFTILILRRGSR